jgi:hypothetical protein
MKQKILAIMAFLCIYAGMAGCEEKNETSSIEITNLEGTLNYSEDTQKWYISVPTPGTYDEVRVFFPCDIEEAYKNANKKVRFSGLAFSLPNSYLAGFTAGSIFFCIEISFIQLL